MNLDSDRELIKPQQSQAVSLDIENIANEPDLLFTSKTGRNEEDKQATMS